MVEIRRTILVTGATGQQGGAVVRHLLASNNWRIRALTRNTGKPESQRLTQQGVEVVQGDMTDRMSLTSALEGVYGVFSVQNTWTSGVEGEIEEGRNVADAAKAAGVRHFLYTSVGGAERNTNIPHFDSKWVIEEHIRSLDLPWTILRPVFFMENFGMPDFKNDILNGTLTFALPPTRRLQLIAVDDIGRFAASAFDNPGQWKGTAVELAGDDLTMPQIADSFSRELDRPVRFLEMPLEQVYSFNREWGVMLEWFNEHGYTADIAALRRAYPALLNFNSWLRTVDWVRAEQLVGQFGRKAA